MPRELSQDDVAAFRDRIGAAATALYAKGGADAITMRELAKALDCSPMGLYRYFRRREELLAFLRADAFNARNSRPFRSHLSNAATLSGWSPTSLPCPAPGPAVQGCRNVRVLARDHTADGLGPSSVR